MTDAARPPMIDFAAERRRQRDEDREAEIAFLHRCAILNMMYHVVLGGTDKRLWQLVSDLRDAILAGDAP
ncbi:MAG TPA: hypothetical protein PKA33_01540 [Amaricoccus sp.]|uniref:hypothetical protein n=1 Tax=Amaricoccus sp. TaxID=1872485 RepID=UPI002BEC34EC|nr:hypothetical protein [Amaricoccus sp.]HMR51222.1 hypothetical protein [Amaricoccus sp.]HMT98029.1 hypothetical protein [Amaricoccus sp.]